MMIDYLPIRLSFSKLKNANVLEVEYILNGKLAVAAVAVHLLRTVVRSMRN